MTILVAGGTGRLGEKIIRALRQRGAEVRAIVRPGTAEAKVAGLEQQDVQVISVDLSDVAGLTEACKGVDCVVSVLSGLREVIVEAQSRLLDAAVAAGVPRFIPSDYAADFTKLEDGTNRNFDLRRAFHQHLDKADIAATSILNGAFADMLPAGRMPLLSFDKKQVSYYGEADQLLDFTTMDNVAEYTAEAALDSTTPKVLRVAGDQISPSQLAQTVSEVTGTQFNLVRSGDLDELTTLIEKVRAADPNRETAVFPAWQGMQYLHNMFSGEAKLEPINNERYPDIKWTTVRDLLEAMPRP